MHPPRSPIYDFAIIDFGYLSLQYSLFRYSNNSCRTLSHVYTEEISGKLIDDVLLDYFMKQIKPQWISDMQKYEPTFFNPSNPQQTHDGTPIEQCKDFVDLTKRVRAKVIKMKELISQAPSVPETVEIIPSTTVAEIVLTEDTFTKLFSERIWNSLYVCKVCAEKIAQDYLPQLCYDPKKRKAQFPPLNLQRIYLTGRSSKLQLFNTILRRIVNPRLILSGSYLHLNVTLFFFRTPGWPSTGCQNFSRTWLWILCKL